MSWENKILAILTADTKDLVELARIAGANPKSFFRNANLRETDLRGQDLSGLDFSGANFSGAILDDVTKIDPAFDPRVVASYTKRYIRIPLDIYEHVMDFQRLTHYAYTGWAIKRLLQVSYYEINIYEKGEDWLKAILNSSEIIKDMRGYRTYRHDLKIFNYYYDCLMPFGQRFKSRNMGILFGIIVALLTTRRIKPEEVGDRSLIELLNRQL